MIPDRFYRLRRLSRILRLGTMASLLGLAVFFVAVALSQDLMTAMVTKNFGPDIVGLRITPVEHALLTLITGIALMPAGWALVSLVQLFTSFAQGDVLSPRAARCLLGLGQAMVIAALAGVLAGALASVALTWDMPDGERTLMLNISSNTISAALFGGLMITVGWAMREAALQAEENRSFV